MSADGSVIGTYKRTKEIGHGSFATVYEGVDTTKKQLVAIKSIYKGRLNKKVRENLSQEIEILKQLHHPHVVHLLEFHETSRDMHIVLEYCILGDLTTFIRRRDHISKHKATRHIMTNYPNPRHGGLNEVLSRHFLQQLATAVRFLRERGLVHRDLKPQNLLLLPPPAYADPLASPAVQPMAGLRTLPMLKVADFGFARHLAEASLADTMCGSPLYMAPEILRSKGYGAEADLWSIGTVLYEMVTARPPFRATNHMELIQKIEGTRDHIRFPEGVAVSSELKAFIRGLLKVEPSRRMGFEEFFGHNVVVGEIPGLVEADLQEQVVQKGVRRASVRDEGATGDGLPDGRMAPPKRPAPRPTNSLPQSRRESIITTHMKAQGRPPSSGTPQIHRTRTEPPISPVSPLQPQPPPQHNRKQIFELEAQARQNGRARALQQQEKERERRAREEQVAMDIALERDYIIVEKRSVEVNCLADAFAEEMAVATSDPAARTRQGQQRGGGQQMIQQAQQEPRPQQRGQEGAGAMTQRHRKQSIKDEEQQQAARSPANNGGMNQESGAVSPAANHKALAIRPSSNSDNNDTLRRKLSLERKFGYSPNSATNALTRVLNMATGRLFGGAVPSLPGGNGGRSPMGFNPFPPYPISNKNLLLECEGLGTGLGSGTGKAVDEDTRILNIIEECATRSDVVYGFAEVKFKQLLPFPPSMTQTQTENVAIRPLREELANGGDAENQQHSGNGVEDDGLAVDAVIGLSEEALVLYVKALSLLAKSMDIAGAWWVRKQMPLSPVPSGPDSPTSDVVPYTLPTPSSPASNGNSNAQANSNIIVVGNQVNNVVQWVRRRFNEVLEKAEYCRKRLVSAQEQLPPDQRPVIDGRDGADAYGHAPAVGPGSSSSSSSALAEKIVLSSGITAEALMYERAVEMSQQAALNELTRDDLQSCEISYVTAIRMLEAVLEGDDQAGSQGAGAGAGAEKGAEQVEDPEKIVNGMRLRDRKFVVELIASTRVRLASLRSKMEMQLQQQQQQKQQPRRQSSRTGSSA